MKYKDYHQVKIGVLGGGQLARMLCQQGQKLGLEVHVLSASNQDPAAQVTAYWRQGSLNSTADLRSFCSKVDLVTFESEFLDSDQLNRLPQKQKIYPRPSIMGLIQDRWSQKSLLSRYKLPTAEYLKIESLDDAAKAFEEFDKGVVFKARRMGYDGYGTFVVRTRKQLKDFSKTMMTNPYGFIAEKLIDFKRELAILAARNKSGDCVFFPLVETFQTHSQCDWVKGPITHSLRVPLQKRIRRFLTDTKYAGVMAFELFDCGNRLLVNELAPRVHNSGHYSLDALTDDQFSMHLKSITNVPLTAPVPYAKGFAMANLLGRSKRVPRWQMPSQGRLHWYGKLENRPRRKMGHINSLSDSPGKALQIALKMRNQVKL